MKTYLVVTVTCPDRPGVVERITEVVVAAGANWEDSRMARLGGDFAGIIKLSVDSADQPQLIDALQSLENDQTHVVVKETSQGEAASAGPAMLRLVLSGADHEGIVHRVAALLAGRGVNVESMETSVAPAPVSATPVFCMTATILVPEQVVTADLRRSLTEIGDSLGVDIELVPLSESGGSG